MTSLGELAAKLRRHDILIRQLQSRSTVSSLLTLGVFGDGSDGNVNLDGTTGYPFATLAGTTYTLTRDIYSTLLAISPGVTVVPAGCRFFVRGGKLTNNGTISAAGLAGTAASFTSINPSVAAPLVGTGEKAGAGGTAAGSSVFVAGAFGAGKGGAGGAGTSAGGTVPATGGAPASDLRLPIHALAGVAGNQSMGVTAGGGGGGGGAGGGGDGTNRGGNGGNGGGMIVIFAQSIVNNGYFIAKGGAGFTPTVGNTGGGGGGGGGVVVAYTLQAWTAGSTDVSGGAGGGGFGTGTAGQPGVAGTVMNVVLA